MISRAGVDKPKRAPPSGARRLWCYFFCVAVFRLLLSVRRIVFGSAATLSHCLISCCTNDGEQLENSVHWSLSVLDYTFFITYYLFTSLPRAGNGRDFWFIGIFWEKGFLGLIFRFIFSLFPVPGYGTSLCYFLFCYYLGASARFL